MKWLLILIPQKLRESQFQHIRAGKQQNYMAYSFFTVVVKAPWWLTLSCAKKTTKVQKIVMDSVLDCGMQGKRFTQSAIFHPDW